MTATTTGNRTIDEKATGSVMHGHNLNHRFPIDTGRNGRCPQAAGVPIEARVHRGNGCSTSNAVGGRLSRNSGLLRTGRPVSGHRN